MIPSSWAFYTAIVCQMTNLTERFVRYHLSYAKGLQYEVVWWRLFYDFERGINCEKLTAKGPRRLRV